MKLRTPETHPGPISPAHRRRKAAGLVLFLAFSFSFFGPGYPPAQAMDCQKIRTLEEVEAAYTHLYRFDAEFKKLVSFYQDRLIRLSEEGMGQRCVEHKDLYWNLMAGAQDLAGLRDLAIFEFYGKCIENRLRTLGTLRNRFDTESQRVVINKEIRAVSDFDARTYQMLERLRKYKDIELASLKSGYEAELGLCELYRGGSK